MANILERWQISADELTDIVDANPSLRGFVMGYISEYKVRRYVEAIRGISNVRKYDDHDRSSKGDISLMYRGKEIKIEVKSLQTNSVKRLDGERWKGKFQCDASDRREIPLPNGHVVNTTCLAVGEFDIVAVSLYSFGGQWRYAFALNSELPHPARKYPAEDAGYLIASLIDISIPLERPFTDNLESLLEKLTV